MLEGQIISVDAEKKEGQVEQILNKRIYPFSFSVWEGEESEIIPNIDVEFVVENRIVTKMKIKISLEEQEAIPVTRSPDDCINEFFAREISILARHQNFVEGHRQIDFMLMRRFLFTAYNDLCELDSALENEELRFVKHEVAFLYRDFQEYNKKIQFPLLYSFEKIFLMRQVTFKHVEQYLEDVKLGMARAKAESEPLGRKLQEEEKTLRFMLDKKSREYLEFEKEVKTTRRRFVDLIDYIARQKEIINIETARLKAFREKHFQSFAEVFTPMTEEIKGRFIKLLNTKGYDLDKEMWARAKKNQYVKKFFRDADIQGGYNSKTYLHYFLKGLDKNKIISPKTKELFDILKSLEQSDIQNIMIVQESEEQTLKSHQLIEHIDSTIKITVEQNPFDALGKLIANPKDIVILDYKVKGLLATDFILEYKQSTEAKNPIFIVITPNLLDCNTEEYKDLGVAYCIQQNDSEAFADAIRMVI